MNKDKEQRVIKFRAWLRDTGIMLSVYLLDQTGKAGTGQHFPTSKGYSEHNAQFVFNIDDADLMQFTGLTDKEGNEIYEGDLLKVIAPYESDDGSHEKIVEVKWHQCGGYIIEWNNGFCGGDADLTTFGWAKDEGYEFEVVGNIYQSK